MRRNEKFYRDKELLRLKRKEDSFFEIRRGERRRKIKSGVGWRRDLSKKLCPKGIYKDLKPIIDMMAEVFREIEPVREYHRYFHDYNDFHSIAYRVDAMLKELNQRQYDELPAASKGFVEQKRHEYTDRYTGECKEYFTYSLKQCYFHYLYTRKAPIYSNYYLSYWNWNNPEYKELRSKINRNHLRPKMCKAASRAYYNGHKDEWNEYKKNALEREYKKQMKQDIEDYYEEREDLTSLLFYYLGLDNDF